MLANHKQIDKRKTMKDQNRSNALGRPAMKLLDQPLQSGLRGRILTRKCIMLET